MKNTIAFTLLALSLVACHSGNWQTDDMAAMIAQMDAAEKAFNERQHRELVALMSLETMFPDPRVRALADAAGRGRIGKVEALVREGVDVNARGTKNATPLF